MNTHSHSRPISTLSFPPKFAPLFKPYRYKVFYGGRGSAKSWSVAQYLVYRALTSPVRVLCAREFQSSIRDSVHRLITDVIHSNGLQHYFKIEHTSITSNAGAQFIFFGLFRNIEAVKSTEGVDICWCEEAERISAESWDILIPTIRKPGSEIIITFNPKFETDPTYQRFVATHPPPPNSIAVPVNWQDNPHFPEVLHAEMEHCKSIDPDKYYHIWEGRTLRYSDALIFRRKVHIESFPPISPDHGERHLYGADWGFANDPTVLLRCFIRTPLDDPRTKDLHIDAEAHQIGCEIPDLPALFLRIPECRHSLIYADNSRPETIQYMKSQGFYIEPAPKWNGSVEDGIEFIRGFRRIVIHPAATNAQYDFSQYSYKTDRLTNTILPTPLPLNDHCITGETEVLTSEGPRPIASMVGTTGLVRSASGQLRPYRNVRCTGIHPVYRVRFNDGSSVCATGDHFFLGSNGWEPVVALRPGSILKHISVSSFTDAPNVGTITIQQSEITRTGSCGPTPWGRFLRGIMFTTLMGIGQIIESRILNYSPNRNTAGSTGKKTTINVWRRPGTALLRLSRLLRNGIDLPKGLSGIGGTRSKSGTWCQQYVSDAGLDIKADSREDFVQMLASLRSAEHPVSMTFCGNVLHVGSVSGSTDIPISGPVAGIAVSGVERLQPLPVFSLEVDGEHTFITAGGLVSHNCPDAIRYALAPFIKNRVSILNVL